MTKAKPQLQPFKSGDRVAFYEGNMSEAWRRRTGTVVEDPDCPDLVLIKNDKDSVHFYMHPKQCRRLRPRPRPQKERVEGYIGRWPEEGFNFSAFHSKPSFVTDLNLVPIKLAELREGEAIVSREALEKAFWAAKKEATAHLPPGYFPPPKDVLDALAKALGLPGKEQG